MCAFLTCVVSSCHVVLCATFTMSMCMFLACVMFMCYLCCVLWGATPLGYSGGHTGLLVLKLGCCSASRLLVNRSEAILIRRKVLCETRLLVNRSETILLRRSVMCAVTLTRSGTFLLKQIVMHGMTLRVDRSGTLLRMRTILFEMNL